MSYHLLVLHDEADGAPIAIAAAQVAVVTPRPESGGCAIQIAGFAGDYRVQEPFDQVVHLLQR